MLSVQSRTEVNVASSEVIIDESGSGSHGCTDSSLQDSSRPNKLPKQKKPCRPCPFCGKFLAKVERHIQTVHREEEAVKVTVNLSRKGQLSVLKQLKREGIKKHNMKQLALKNPVLERERNRGRDTKMVICGICSAFLVARFFSQHRRNCKGQSADIAIPLPLSMLKTQNETVSAEFRADILSKFRDDEIGQLCIADPVVLLVGSRMYEKMSKKPEKAGEVKKSVRTDMRRLSSLYIHFKEIKEERIGKSESNTDAGSRPSVTIPTEEMKNRTVDQNASEMLQRRNFTILEEAIERYTTRDVSEGGIKAGLKMSIFYLLRCMAKIVKATFLVRDQDEKAAEIDKFLQVLDLNQNIIFGDAVYAINHSRQTKLRMPAELAKDVDVELLREHTVSKISLLSSDPYIMWTNKEFSMLRDLAVSRLTLFNARRGGEPARLSMSAWKAAEDGVWVDEKSVERLTDVEKKLFSDLKIAYQSGKGNSHLVPVLIPKDTVPALQLLSNTTIRAAAGVLVTNLFLFPSTQHSAEHVSGWHAVHKVCVAAKVSDPTRLTATKMRHRISTIYAAMDVPQNERQFFYSHMGHSAEINADIYQTPPAIAEISKVGRCLQQMDITGNL